MLLNLGKDTKMRKLIYTSFGLIVIFLSTFIPVSSSFAATAAVATTSDHLVVVALDVTMESHCSASKILNVGTRKQFTVNYACPAGSITKTETVYLSQALAQHEPYVVLPSSTSSQKALKHFLAQVQQLETAVREKAERDSHNSFQGPSIARGSSATPSVNWTANGDSVHTYVHYTKSSDCSTVFIQFSGVQGNTAPNPLWWDHDQYASWPQGVGCPFVGTNNWSINWNITQPVNYTFEHWLENQACPWFGYTSYHDDIRLN